MKRNKKLLMYFLALNTIMSSYLGAVTTAPVKYDKMYNSMVKNIEKGNSNEENYKLIEKVLNQRNKELKDLYKQSDYIVKPEYLEWQVFFSGFYDERSRGDNTFENAEYHSDPSYNQQGYYDVNGQYVVTDQGQGKPYAKPQEPKEINLGVSIPIKGMTRGPLNLAITPAGAINISPATLNVVLPSGIVTPAISTYKFDITTPTVTIPAFNIPPSFSVSVPNTGNWDESFNCLSGTCQNTSKIGQYNLTAGVIDATWGSSSLSSFTVTGLLGTIDPNLSSQGQVAGASYANITTPLNVVAGTGNGAVALYKQTAGERYVLGTPGDVNSLTMIIRSTVAPLYASTLPHLIQIDPHWNVNPF